MSSADRSEVPAPARSGVQGRQVLQSFADAWRRGRRPDIAAYLSESKHRPLALLTELVHQELRFRVEAGESVRVEEYLERFPELAGDTAAVVDLIVAEWQLRAPRLKITPDEYLERFPAYREQLRARLPFPEAADGTDKEDADAVPSDRVCAATLATLLPIEYVPPLESVSPQSKASEVRPMAEPDRHVAVARGRPRPAAVLLGVLTLTLALGNAALFTAYRKANDRCQETEYAQRELHAALAQVQGTLGQAQKAAQAAEAGRLQEEKRRREAERERRQHQASLYAQQLAGAQRLLREGDAKQALAVLAQCRPESRHWEWRYLRHLGHADRAAALTLDSYFVADPAGGRGIALSVRAAAFTPDGVSLLSFASDPRHTRNELRLWRLATGRVVRTFPCPGLRLSRLCLSADGRVLAVLGPRATGGQPEVRLWYTQTGKELPTLRREGHDIIALALSPDGEWLATCGKEGTTRVWDTAKGEERWHREGRACAEGEVAASPDGKQIVSVGGSILLLDSATGKDEKPLEIEGFSAVGAAFSPDGRWLALSGTEKGRACVRLRHRPSGEEWLTLRDFGGTVYFSPEGGHLVALSSGGAHLWESHTGRTRTLPGLERLGIHPDGQRVLLHREGRFEIRSLTAPPESRIVGDAASSLDRAPPGIIPLADVYGPPIFSDDGRRLAAAYRDGRVRVWDLASGRPIGVVAAPPSRTLALSHSGKHLATTAAEAGSLVVWDADTGTERCRLHCPGVPARVIFSPSGALLAVATVPDPEEKPRAAAKRAELSVWETATGTRRFTRTGMTATEFLSLVFTPDEKRLLDFTPRIRGEARGWDLVTGEEIAQKSPFVSGLAPVFSPDGRLMACHGPTISRSHPEVCLADAVSGLVLWSARLEDGDAVSGLAFSPDGRRLAASCAKGGRVRSWDVETGQELFSLAAHAEYAGAVRFTVDGQSVLTLGLEDPRTQAYTVKRWEGPSAH